MGRNAKSIIHTFAKSAAGDNKKEIERRASMANELARANGWRVRVTVNDKAVNTELTEELIDRKMELLMGKQGQLVMTPLTREDIRKFVATGKRFKSTALVDPEDLANDSPLDVDGDEDESPSEEARKRSGKRDRKRKRPQVRPRAATQSQTTHWYHWRAQSQEAGNSKEWTSGGAHSADDQDGMTAPSAGAQGGGHEPNPPKN